MKDFFDTWKFKILVAVAVFLVGIMAYAGANGRLTAAPQELLSVAAAPFQNSEYIRRDSSGRNPKGGFPVVGQAVHVLLLRLTETAHIGHPVLHKDNRRHHSRSTYGITFLRNASYRPDTPIHHADS